MSDPTTPTPTLTGLLPSPAQIAANKLDSINLQVANNLRQIVTKMNEVMTQTKSTDGKTMLSFADIDAAVGGRLANQPALLAALQAIIGV